MRNKSDSKRRPGFGSVWDTVVESLETRWHLSTTVKTPSKGAIQAYVPTTVAYRPASDETPTANGTKSVAKAAGKNSRAYTNYVKLLPKNTATPSNVGSTTPVGLTAAQVRAAYGMDNITFGGIVGDGEGQTIAIIDAYDHPGFVSSTDPNYVNSDLHQFSVAMGLPDPPSFTKLDQYGGTNYPAPNSAWAAEIALDVEWAHAMAPKANIVLIEANSNSFGDLVMAAVNTARNLPNVSVISMSFGFDGGFAGEAFFDAYFTAPAGHQGITFLASSGDHGAVVPAGGTTGSAAYPAESPNVVAVGGTNLTVSGNAYVSENGWSGSGGGISNFQAKPGFQSGVGPSNSYRMTPDVSILGDPATGVAVYDSYNNTSNGGWNNYAIGGTSLSAPLFSGVIAVANQGRANIGLGTLNGPTQTLQRLYQLPAATLHDITTGNNGYAAGTGYDLVTGRGTPVGQSTLTSLAGGTYTGFTYLDKDGSGTYNASIDTKLAGMQVWNDANGNASLDGNETTAFSDANGNYTLDLPAGITLSVRTFLSANGYFRTSSATAGSGTTAYGTFSTGSFGFFPIAYNLPSGQANGITFRLDSTGARFQVFVNTPTTGAATYSISKTLISTQTLTVNGGDGDDTLTIDVTYGTPMTAANFVFNGNAQTTGDTVNIVATPVTGTSATYTPTSVAVATKTIVLSGVEARQFTGKSGNDSVTMNSLTAATTPTFVGGGGTDSILVQGFNSVYQPTADLGADGTAVNVTVGQQGRVVFAASQRLNSLDLSGQGTAQLAAGARVLRTSALSINTGQLSYLDLTDGALIYDYASTSPLSTVAALVASGYANGLWNGYGIRSSTAAATASRTVGFGEAASAFNLSGSATATFYNQTVDATTLVARYTTVGDADLNGTTDFNDFLRLQTNYGTTGRAFTDGDVDYDGDVDFNDFLGLQAAFGVTA